MTLKVTKRSYEDFMAEKLVKIDLKLIMNLDNEKNDKSKYI